MSEQKRPFGLWDKIGYMFGDFGNDFSFLFASNYLMVFYTKFHRRRQTFGALRKYSAYNRGRSGNSDSLKGKL